MCRLLGIVSKKRTDVEWLGRFRRLAHTGILPKGRRGHRDGWGVGYFRGGVGMLVKEPEDAMDSHLFSELLGKKLPTRFLAHLRHASYGGVSYENTHPFLIENTLFCHNGTIYTDFKRRTDSEGFFESIVRTSRKDDLKEAIVKTSYAMKKKFRYTSLSFLLLTPQMLLAYRDYRIYKNYYTLFFARRKDAFIVCSERLDREKWTALENKELLCVYNDMTFERGFYG